MTDITLILGLLIHSFSSHFFLDRIVCFHFSHTLFKVESCKTQSSPSLYKLTSKLADKIMMARFGLTRWKMPGVSGVPVGTASECWYWRSYPWDAEASHPKAAAAETFKFQMLTGRMKEELGIPVFGEAAPGGFGSRRENPSFEVEPGFLFSALKKWWNFCK